MTEFVVELYASRSDTDALERSTERLREAAEELRAEGTAVRYLRRIFVPDDETCLLFYEADSADAVSRAAQRADVPFERVAAAVVESSDAEEMRPCP